MTSVDDAPVPLFLVRWPGLVAALVSAANEDELLDILDETANPEGCTWSLYRGPLYVELALNVEHSIEGRGKARDLPLEPSEVQVGDVTRVCERDVMRAVLDLDSETSANMIDAITKQAFPSLYPVLRKVRETIPEDEVRDAVRAELDTLIRPSWQQQQTKRRPDRESRVAATLGTSPRLVGRRAKTVRAAGKRAGVRSTPRKPTKPTRNGPGKKSTK